MLAANVVKSVNGRYRMACLMHPDNKRLHATRLEQLDAVRVAYYIVSKIGRPISDPDLVGLIVAAATTGPTFNLTSNAASLSRSQVTEERRNAPDPVMHRD